MKTALPATVTTPLSVRSPVIEVATRLVLAVTAPKSKAPLSRITTKVPVAATDPPKEFKALFKITGPLAIPEELTA